MSVRNKLSPLYEQTVSTFIYTTTSLMDVLPWHRKRYLSAYEENKCAFHKVLAEHNPAHATSIALEMRKVLASFESRGSDDWWIETPNGLKSVTKILQFRPEYASIFSMSPNGYVREKSVKQWQSINSSFELALLLIRLNDWVGPVRSAAISTLERLISLPAEDSGLTPENVLGCMDLVLNPNRFGRSHEIELSALNQISHLQGIPQAFERYILESSVDNAPRYLLLGLQRRMLMGSLTEFASSAKHADVRKIATKTVLNGEHVWTSDPKVERVAIKAKPNCIKVATCALNDKSPAVQRVALDYIIEHKPSQLHTETIYRKFVTNKRISIVERAIYGLKSLGIDRVEEVRKGIESGTITKHSLGIMARYGNSKDGKLIYQNLDQVDVSNKLFVLGAAAKLGHVTAIKDLENIAINSIDDSISYSASIRLHKTSYSPDFGAIMRSIHSGQNIYNRGYMPFIRQFKIMELAQAIAAIKGVGYPHDHSRLWELLGKKRNIGAFSPTDQEIAALRENVGNSNSLRDKFERILGIKL